MGKITWIRRQKPKKRSLKWSIIPYVPICLALIFLGGAYIGFATNDLQDWYRSMHSDLCLNPDVIYELRIVDGQIIVHDELRDGEHLNSSNAKYFITYWIISYAQVILIPAWVLLCLAGLGWIFYNRELKKPINLLLDAARKIADNELNFKITYDKPNELGMLCSAFDEMRQALYDSNQEMWRSLEERKRLNSAFSHDLRTPLTVLRGYADFLEKYIPDDKVSEEKLLAILSMMNGQITRLEHYTQKMSAVQKLEDIVPNIAPIPAETLFQNLTEAGELVCGDKFKIDCAADREMLFVDTELVLQVYENLISNAIRYAETSVEVNCTARENTLTIAVLDDGKGFTEDALKHAVQPFFRDEKEPDKLHFGLGLYICRILCEKCGGRLAVENHENGGKVTVEIFCGEFSESR